MTHFSVKNYKCLADVSIPLTPIHVIIGQNDSGKTSLLEAMFALHQSTSLLLMQAFPGKWDGAELIYEGAKEPRVEFDAVFEDRIAGKVGEMKYHLIVEFQQQSTACRRTDEWYQNGEASQISEVTPDSTGLFRRGIQFRGSYFSHGCRDFPRLGRCQSGAGGVGAGTGRRTWCGGDHSQRRCPRFHP